MARRATAIKQERERTPGIVLLLDAGDSLVGQWVSLQSRGQVVVEAMNAMKYDAVGLGQLDCALGVEALKQREAEANFALVSANVVSVDTRQPVFRPYVILEREGTHFGILGLTEPKAAQYLAVRGKATVLDPTEVARVFIAELRNKVDILIVLSHLGLEADVALAQAVPGIDIIVGGNTRRLMKQPEQLGNTLIIQQGYRGEWMGRLDVVYDAEGLLDRSIVEIIALEPRFADDPEVAALVEKWKALYPSPTPRPTWTPRAQQTPTARQTPTLSPEK